MIVHQCAAKTARDGGGVKPGHADHHKPSLPAIAVAREIAVDAPSHGLNDIGQRLAGDMDPPLGAKNAEIRCQRGNHILKHRGIFNLV